MNSSIQLQLKDAARSPKTRVRNTEGIKQFSNQKTHNACIKAQAAIDRLLQRKQKVNFNTVSLEAGVSKPFLYTQSELRRQIESLRQQTEQAPPPELSILLSLKLENEKLKQQVDKLQKLLNNR